MFLRLAVKSSDVRLDHVLFRVFTSPVKTGEDEYLVVCPFHEDRRPSCSINCNKLLFKCHACGVKGSAATAIAKELGGTESLVQSELLFLKEMTVLPEFNAQFFHKKLLASKEMYEYLVKERFWSEEVINNFVIGYDGNRVTIPVFNLFGDLVNVRAYKPKAKKNEDKFINLKGFGKARIFNAQALTSKSNTATNVIVCEGEPDTLAAVSYGITAVCSTSGAGFSRFLNSSWTTHGLALAYDTDDPGKSGARKLSESLNGPHKLVDLTTLIGDRGKDLTDAFTLGVTAEQIKMLVDSTPYTERTATVQTSRKIKDYGEPVQVTLQESGEERFYHKLVKMKVMVSGKTLSPYLIPSTVEVTCPLPGLNMCNACGLGALGGKSELKFDHLNAATLELIETSAESQLRVYKTLLNIPVKCRLFNAEVTEAQNIEEVKVIPVLEYSLDDSEYVMRQIYYVGHGLKANRSYELSGLTLPHPKTQQVTYMINEVESLEDSVASFTVTDEIINSLKIFKVDNEEDQG
jgi:5S rRNA maturation endonuclease (ribonuclease M5)